jgi:hypothetical protein
VTDLLHTHLSPGFVPGCPACAQVAADFRAISRARRFVEVS